MWIAIAAFLGGVIALAGVIITLIVEEDHYKNRRAREIRAEPLDNLKSLLANSQEWMVDAETLPSAPTPASVERVADKAKILLILINRASVSVMAMGDDGTRIRAALDQYTSAFLAAMRSFQIAFHDHTFQTNPVIAHHDQLMTGLAEIEKEYRSARLT